MKKQALPLGLALAFAISDASYGAVLKRFETVAINTYSNNGCPTSCNFNFNYCTNDADNLSTKMTSYGWTNMRKAYQTLAKNTEFAGTGAPVTQYDFAYFVGHGD